MTRDLTAVELARFGRDGYLVVPDAVDPADLAPVDDEVDRTIADVPPDEGHGVGQQAWFRPIARLPRAAALLRSGPLAIAEQLVAPHRLEFAFDHVQLAITVPPWSHVPGGPHIDGHGPGPDPPASFTLLAGILLTDQTEPATGNLWVWPGSHLAHADLFRARGVDALRATHGHATLLEAPPALGAPRPVLGRRGDLVLAHFLLGHNKGGNEGSATRRTLYYRLASEGHRDRWADTFVDPWTEYPPVRAALTA